MELKVLEEAVENVEIEFGKDTLNFQFNPYVISVELVQKSAKAEQENADKATTDFLLEVGRGWDLTRQGEPLPFNAENLKPFGFVGRSRIFQAVWDKAIPSPNSETDSTDI